MSAIRNPLNGAMDDRVPALHREQVTQAGKLIDDAARLLGQVRHSYRPDDATVAPLLEVLIRCDLALGAIDGWLSRHPARG